MWIEGGTGNNTLVGPDALGTWNITEHVVFKGATVLGINGRKMFETWYQMEELLLSGKLELDDIITHEFPLEQFEKAFATIPSIATKEVVWNRFSREDTAPSAGQCVRRHHAYLPGSCLTRLWRATRLRGLDNS